LIISKSLNKKNKYPFKFGFLDSKICRDILIICIYITCNIVANSLKHIYDINNFLWKKRVLVVRTVIKDREITNFDRYSKGVIDRDMLVVQYQKNKSIINNSLMRDSFHKSISEIMDNIDRKFCCVLIGKDGGVKKTYLSTADTSIIFFDIDQMPMRRVEMLSR
tara:strand:+ start:18379 stop:18870 length:492 start_codon:yes stop_codon:yes gene_type:complete